MTMVTNVWEVPSICRGSAARRGHNTSNAVQPSTLRTEISYPTHLDTFEEESKHEIHEGHPVYCPLSAIKMLQQGTRNTKNNKENLAFSSSCSPILRAIYNAARAVYHIEH